MTIEEFYSWVGTWWGWSGCLMADIVDQSPPPEEPLLEQGHKVRWDLVYDRLVNQLPDEIDGMDVMPIKSFVIHILAYLEPGYVYGPRPSENEMFKASSDALRVKNGIGSTLLNPGTNEEKRAHHPKKTMPIDSDVADVCNRIADAGDDANITQICREVAKLRQRDSGSLRNAYYRWKKKQP